LQTRYVELRGNYYLPLTDRQLAEERRTRQTLQSSRSADSTSVTSSGDPFATGNLIAQDAVFTTRRTTTTRSTTIESLFRRYEEGMEGWDAEVAFLVPGVDKYLDVKLLAGYYSYDNQPFGPQQGGTGNVQGWKGGVEVRPVPAVILSGTWYEDDRLTGGDWTAGVQLQIPFEAGDLGDGKGFWSRIGESFRPRRRHLVERMAEPVHRQNAAVKVASSEEKSQRVVAVKTKRVTRVVSQSQRRIVLEDDVVFANNGADVGNGIQTGMVAGTGTAETPVDTVQAAATIAGNNSTATGRVWNVYTQGGTGTPYNDSVTLTGSTRFISSQQGIAGVQGKVFGGNTARPNIIGGFNADASSTPAIAFFELNGYDVSGGFQGLTEGVFVLDVPTSIIRNNVVHDVAGGDGISIFSVFSPMTAVISDNEVTSVSGSGISVVSGGLESVNAVVQRNTITGAGVDGISVNVFENQFSGLIDGNEINATTGNAINIGVSGGTWLANVTSNVVNGAGASGILIDATNANWTGNVSSNEVTDTAVSAIAISASSDNGVGTFWNGNVSSNSVFANTGDGLVFSNNGPGTGNLFFTGSFTGNSASFNTGTGIFTDVIGAGSTFLGGPFNGNTATFNGINFDNNPVFFGTP
ncbi:MAG TPA: right-handed parallel beta-helix repeat-containing protein, partial [Verrucomicrobium sp.]|nr:right-handed parallel beta-helix repeat-containing protein [Verrucomicrobium sp.]